MQHTVLPPRPLNNWTCKGMSESAQTWVSLSGDRLNRRSRLRRFVSCFFLWMLLEFYVVFSYYEASPFAERTNRWKRSGKGHPSAFPPLYDIMSPLREKVYSKGYHWDISPTAALCYVFIAVNEAATKTWPNNHLFSFLHKRQITDFDDSCF